MSRPQHWLLRIVERAGIGSADQLDLPPGTPMADAWTVVCRRFGISDEDLARKVAEYYRLDPADLSLADPQATSLVPEELARKHQIVPIRDRGRTVVVATADPTDVDVERAVAFTSSRTVVFEIASPSAIRDVLDSRFQPVRQVETLLGSMEAELEEVDALKLVEEMGPEEVSRSDADATPVIKLTNLIIADGIAAGASDIHVEPGRGTGAVRYRVDGVLRKHMDLPMAALNRVVSRIKILARLDIADRLRPQDGKARVRIRNVHYDLRVSTLPAAGSEKCVIRILDSSASVTLDDLALPEPELERLRALLTHRDGVVVITGPTGSGKTTTLYGALREMADGQINIMTVEDPIEYDLPAITQTQVETKQGVTFGSTLRAILRQDPDVILVGEIRDEETAEVAAQAAMTGHLVLTTVHANDAVSAVARLADIGLPYPTIAQTLRGGLAQRLLRRVCPTCSDRIDGDLTAEEKALAERYGEKPRVRAVGCAECGYTGYRGRLPVVEVLVSGPRFQDAIEQRKGNQTLHRVARESGMRSMREVALDRVRDGSTTLVEVERVLGQVTEEVVPEARTGPPRILVVDDDADARLLVRSLMEQEGFEVLEAGDGDKALETLKREADVAMVVLDLDMPGLGGRELLNVIRGTVATAAVPVLIRTGIGTPRDEAELLDAGADEFVSKTTDSARLMARVRAVLRRAV
jgi:type II secretory ATPase GspE/PulE/Tfp pilus assembly ATPase PilB-like protein/ActR/RegA family two-component response regulator